MRYLIFSLTTVLMIGPVNSSQAQDDVQQARRIVSQYKAVFDAPPKHVPSFHSVDGPITGNGDIGLTQSGPPANQRYWISKNDFWKSGPDFKQCGPSLIGGVDVRIEALKDASYHVEQVLYEPLLTSRFATADNAVTMDARVLATENVIVLELKAASKPLRVQLSLWVKDGYGSTTENGQEGELRWVARKFNAANLLYPTEAAVALRMLEGDRDSFTLEPGKPVTIVVAVATNHESVQYLAAAKDKVKGLRPANLARLKAEHDKWWQGFWAASYVEIEDKLLEKFYYAGHYIMACCSRNERFPPGLYGNWITMDRTAWSGDIHLNYNHQAPFWALYSSNRVKLTDCYDAPLLEHLKGFQADARKYLDKKGAYASVAIGPKGLNCRFFDKEGMDKAYKEKCGGSGSYEDLAGQPMFLGQKSNAIFGSMNMLLRYRYTYDRAYIEKVYPYLLAVAAFWEDYLTFEGGRYVIHDDSFQEVGPWEGKGWEKAYGDFNPIISLGFLRVFLGAMIDISTDLKRDEDRRAQWKHILANLSELPVATQDGRKRFRACEGGHGGAANIVGLDWIMMHALVFPAPNIGLGSDAESLTMIRDDMKQWDDKIWIGHGNAFQTLFIGAARVGFDPEFLLAKASEAVVKRADPNLWIPAGGGGIETCSGIPGMINEMMLQSHNDVIRVFPVFPSNQKASFYRLRTFGAFLVSSELNEGQIPRVVIESEKGRPCNVLNPWPGKSVCVFRNGREDKAMSETILKLATERGEKLLLVPEDGKK